MDASLPDVRNVGTGNPEGNAAEVEGFRCYVDEISTRVNKLEQRVNEVEQFYLTASKNQLNTSKGKDKRILNIKKQQQDASRREAAAAKRMQELMRQFSTILRNTTQHEWAWPFMNPVEVERLGLHDYYEVIKKPMDLGTIKNRMEAKDGTGYKNVREMDADVRLVFENAMKYNEPDSDAHKMATTLLEIYQAKWRQLLPKVEKEEKRRHEEEAEAQLEIQLAQEADHATIAKDISNELYEVDTHLEELREMVIQKCRKISTEEKRKLMAALSRLTSEDLCKVVEIVAEYNPSFPATAEEVDLDIDAQSESALWKLKFFMKNALQNQVNNPATNNDDNSNKRKREICDALAKSSVKKKTKKLPS